VSARHPGRLFRDELNTTPARYAGNIRFDGAKAALEAGFGVTESAQRVGYGSSETLRRVFTARLGISPSADQPRFRSAPRPDAAP
jgi:transcriptional regulator GlxA family with amidase domain